SYMHSFTARHLVLGFRRLRVMGDIQRPFTLSVLRIAARRACRAAFRVSLPQNDGLSPPLRKRFHNPESLLYRRQLPRNSHHHMVALPLRRALRVKRDEIHPRTRFTRYIIFFVRAMLQKTAQEFACLGIRRSRRIRAAHAS